MPRVPDVRNITAVVLSLFVLGAVPVVALACDIDPIGAKDEPHPSCPHHNDTPPDTETPSSDDDCLFHLCTCQFLFSPGTLRGIPISAPLATLVSGNASFPLPSDLCFAIDHPPRVNF